jgi:solute carrier family 25 folate transporter 32
VASLPAYVVYVTSYTWSKSALGFNYGPEVSTAATAVAPLAAGVIADAACLGFYVPVDVVTQRLQLPGRYTGARQAVTRMWRDEGGVRAFYRGFTATLITSGVSSGVWWLAYENLKQVFSAAWHSGDSDVKQGLGAAPSSSQAAQAMEHSLPHMAAGFVSGGLAALASNPFDVVKTRLQTQQLSLARNEPRPAGLREFVGGLRCLVVEEGLRGALFRGLVPKLITTAPLGMLSSFLYETILYMSRKDTPLAWPKPPVEGAGLETSLHAEASSDVL